MLFTIKRFREIDFLSKKWQNYPKIDLKPPSNLVEMIERALDFEMLKEFKGSFAWDELVDILNARRKNYMFFQILNIYLN